MTSSELRLAAEGAFRYAAKSRPRKHGPRGYANYQSYKPWLRDEFCCRNQCQICRYYDRRVATRNRVAYRQAWRAA